MDFQAFISNLFVVIPNPPERCQALRIPDANKLTDFSASCWAISMILSYSSGGILNISAIILCFSSRARVISSSFSASLAIFCSTLSSVYIIEVKRDSSRNFITGRSPRKLRAHAALNYKTQRERDCSSRGARPPSLS